ncbi:MAG: energy transducer TonB [Pedobacter sp.]|nr:MAG: energy transducer TonB [Pedobacter sp.]
MIQTKKTLPVLPGYSIYKSVVAAVITLVMAVCLLILTDLPETQFNLFTVASIVAWGIGLLVFSIPPRYRKDNVFSFFFAIVTILIFIVGQYTRQNYRADQLASYGTLIKAEVTDVKKSYKKFRYRWTASFVYYVNGKRYRSTITKKQDEMAPRDLIEIRYSSKDPDLYEVVGVIKYKEPDSVGAISAIDSPPSFPGGAESLYSMISENLTYPELAIENGTSGTVYLSFVIGKDGSIEDVTVVKGIGDGCDEAAVEVLKRMPKWNPGIQDGKAVRVKYNIPIKFSL